jgi:hypothetical protein
MRCRVASVTSTDDNAFLRMRSEMVVNDSYGKSDDIGRFFGARKDASPRKTAARSLRKRARKISSRPSRACLARPSPLVFARRRDGDDTRACHSDRKPFSTDLAPGECGNARSSEVKRSRGGERPPLPDPKPRLRRRLKAKKRLAFGSKSSMCVDVRGVEIDRRTTLRPSERMERARLSETARAEDAC